MIENVGAGMNVLRCPTCSAPLTLKGHRSNVAYCEYCQKKIYYFQSKDGKIHYSDRKPRKKSGESSALKKIIILGWLLAVVLLAVIAANTGKGGKEKEVSEAHKRYLEKITTKTFEWPGNTLGDVVPVADFPNGWMYNNSSESFAVDIGNVSKQEFETYMKECIDAGFNVNSNNAGSYMHAFNNDGYELQLSYDIQDGSMSVIAHAPKEMEEYEWPQTGLATLLPVPKSSYGVVEMSDDRLKAEIYQISVKEFESYVDECIKGGFDNHYDKSVSMGYFKGYDDNGYELYISYEENDYNQTMKITLDHD